MLSCRITPRLATLLLTLALGAYAAQGTTITGVDPPFQIGPCTSGGTFCGGHPNNLGATDVIDFNLQGSHNDTIDNIYLILGIPIVSGSFASPPSISALSPTAGQLGGGGGGNYGATWNATTGDAGAFVQPATGTTTIYDGLNDTLTFVPSGDSSENSSNWFAAYTGNNSGGNLLGVTSYEIFVYTLSDPGLLGNGGGSVLFTADLPLGAIVVGYACDQPSGTTCGTDAGNVWSTPFTQAGLVTSGPTGHHAPEPASLALMGSGLLLIGGLLRRKIKMVR